MLYHGEQKMKKQPNKNDKKNDYSFFFKNKISGLIICLVGIPFSILFIFLPIICKFPSELATLFASMGVSILSASLINSIFLAKEMFEMKKRREELLSRIVEKSCKFFLYLFLDNDFTQSTIKKRTVESCIQIIEKKKKDKLFISDLTLLLEAHLYSDLCKCDEKDVKTCEWKGINSCKVYLETGAWRKDSIIIDELKLIVVSLKQIPFVDQMFNKDVGALLDRYDIKLDIKIGRKKAKNTIDVEAFSKYGICMARQAENIDDIRDNVLIQIEERRMPHLSKKIDCKK